MSAASTARINSKGGLQPCWSEGYSLGYSFSAPMAAASDSGAYYSSNVLSTQTDGAYNLTTPLSTPQRIPSHPLIFKTHLERRHVEPTLAQRQRRAPLHAPVHALRPDMQLFHPDPSPLRV